MRAFLKSNWASPAIGAAIWIIVTFATGGKATFALIGGAASFFVIYGVQETYRQLVLKKRNTPPASGGNIPPA